MQTEAPLLHHAFGSSLLNASLKPRSFETLGGNHKLHELLSNTDPLKNVTWPSMHEGGYPAPFSVRPAL